MRRVPTDSTEVPAPVGFLALRGGADGRGGVGGETKAKKHWLRSGSPPPRYTHPFSSPKMEKLWNDLELDLENEDEAKINALIRELDRDLPRDDSDAEDSDKLRELKERVDLLKDHAPSLYNYARALQIAGQDAQAERFYQESLSCCVLTNSSSQAERLCVAAICCNLGGI